MTNLKDAEIYEEVKKRATTIIRQGKSVVRDSTNLQKDRRRDFIQHIKSILPGTTIKYKLLELNTELAKQRIKS